MPSIDPRTTRDDNDTTPLLPSQQKTSMSTFWKIGAIYGAAAVGLGAFGAHGLKKHISDPKRIANWGTAAQYQLVHSVVVLIAANHPLAAGLLTTGMTLFSGSLYALTLDPERFRFMGPVTPLGGLFLIAGWLALAFTKGRSGVPPWPRF